MGGCARANARMMHARCGGAQRERYGESSREFGACVIDDVMMRDVMMRDVMRSDLEIRREIFCDRDRDPARSFSGCRVAIRL